LQTFSELNLKI